MKSDKFYLDLLHYQFVQGMSEEVDELMLIAA